MMPANYDAIIADAIRCTRHATLEVGDIVALPLALCQRACKIMAIDWELGTADLKTGPEPDAPWLTVPLHVLAHAVALRLAIARARGDEVIVVVAPPPTQETKDDAHC